MGVVCGPRELDPKIRTAGEWCAWARGPKGERQVGRGTGPHDALLQLTVELKKAAGVVAQVWCRPPDTTALAVGRIVQREWVRSGPRAGRGDAMGDKDQDLGEREAWRPKATEEADEPPSEGAEGHRGPPRKPTSRRATRRPRAAGSKRGSPPTQTSRRATTRRGTSDSAIAT